MLVTRIIRDFEDLSRRSIACVLVMVSPRGQLRGLSGTS